MLSSAKQMLLSEMVLVSDKDLEHIEQLIMEAVSHEGEEDNDEEDEEELNELEEN